MKARLLFTCSILILLFSFAYVALSHPIAAQTPTELQQWEYIQLVVSIDPPRAIAVSGNPNAAESINDKLGMLSGPKAVDGLKFLGEEGWELVAMVNIGNGALEQYTLKRPLQP